MPLAALSLTNFRNHAASQFGDLAQFNLLIGENGAGKTNVLEALSLLAPGRGLRRAALADIAAQSGDGSFAVSAALAEDRAIRIGTGMQAARPNRRMTRINGADASAAAIGEWFATSWLTPAMDRLFTDSASARRRFLDRLVVALEPGHAREAARYDTALRERNRLLCADAMAEPRWFSALEAQLAEAGARIADARQRIVAALGVALAAHPSEPFARPDLALAPGGPTTSAPLAQELERQRPRERAAGRTLVGPHRDELVVTMAGKGVPAAQCSTGEQKAMLIAIVLAHLDLALDERPGLLLLDEVAAHLDPLRRAALFDRLRAGRAQVWLTGTETAPFEAIGGEAAIWRVASGEAERL